MVILYPKPNILIISNSETSTTFYGHFYLSRFADYARNKGFGVVHLENAILADLQTALIETNPRLVILNGHGGEYGVLGQDRHVIAGVECAFDEELGLTIYRSNVNWFRDRIVFLLCCYSGEVLGKKLVEEGGAEAVVGWTKPFFFIGESILSPPEDSKARPFFKPPIHFLKLLLDGFTVKESFNAMIKQFHTEATKWRSRDIDVYKFLLYDAKHAVLHGYADATL